MINTRVAWLVVALSPVLLYFVVRALMDFDRFESRRVVYEGATAVAFNSVALAFTAWLLTAAIRKLLRARRDPDWKKIDE